MRKRRSMLGKLISDREIPSKGMLPALQKSWKNKKFQISRIEDNTFQFKFETTEEVSRVLAEGPWCFDDHLFVLRGWQEDWKTCPKFFDFSDFWIHLTNLPTHFFTEHLCARIVNEWEGCKSGQLRVEKGFGSKFFQFQVTIDVTKPIRRFYCVKLMGSKMERGLLQYERIPSLCVLYGHNSHVSSEIEKR